MNTIAVIVLDTAHGDSCQLQAFLGENSVEQLYTHLTHLRGCGAHFTSVHMVSYDPNLPATRVSLEGLNRLIALDYTVRLQIVESFTGEQLSTRNSVAMLVLQVYENLWEDCCISALNLDAPRRTKARLELIAFQKRLLKYKEGMLNLYELTR